MLAAALGKSISGPLENLLCPRDRTVLQPVTTVAPVPITAKPMCPLPPNQCAQCRAFGHWKDECPKARKEDEAPSVVGLADLEINQGCQGSEISGPQKPMVTLKVGNQNTDFMVDTGAELSVVTKPVAPLSKKTTAVTGIGRRDD